MSFNMNGTMADYFVAAEDDLEPTPEGLPQDLACLGEPAVKIDALINRHFKLDRVAEAFRTDIEDPASMKVVLGPSA